MRQVWFSGYIQTYLERDLRQLSALSNLPDFQRLMTLVANRTTRPVNQSDMARDGVLVTLEIKQGHQVAPSDADGIRAFASSLGNKQLFRRGVILHQEEARPLGQGLFA